MLSPPNGAMQIVSWPLERLIPYARNARVHSAEQVAQVAASIIEFGFNCPVLVGPGGDIIAGHARVLAARQLERTEVPVVVLGHLNEAQQRAFRLADNQLALNANWDFDLLRQELEALAAQAFNLELIGFAEQELARLLAPPVAGLSDPDAVPEPLSQPVSRPGDLWLLGRHRLLCGDGTSAADLNRVLEGHLCNLVFTDLPYNVDYTGKGRRPMKLANDRLGAQFGGFLEKACRRLLEVSQGPLYICMSSGELHRLHSAFCAAGGHWSTYIIWAKNTFTLGHADYQRQYEPLLYGWRQDRPHYWCGDRKQGDVWLFDKPLRNDLHPTMKPVALVERAVCNSSQAGELVLDPYGGGGSTLIACENLNRSAALIEIAPEYVDVTVRRWEQYTGERGRLDGDGRDFEEIAAARVVVVDHGKESGDE